jgi:hypothetical protein
LPLPPKSDQAAKAKRAWGAGAVPLVTLTDGATLLEDQLVLACSCTVL